MKVLFLGWARLELAEKEGSGYNLVASGLAKGLSDSGIEVVYLRAGRSFTFLGGPSIQLEGRWGQIPLYQLINSAVIAPGAFGFGASFHAKARQQTCAVIVDFCQQQQIQGVEVHSLEGVPYELISALKKAGIATWVTLHDFHFFCPQVNFMKGGVIPCISDSKGRDCETCLPRQLYWIARWKHCLRNQAPRLLKSLKKWIKHPQAILNPSEGLQSNDKLLQRFEENSNHEKNWVFLSRELHRKSLGEADVILPPSKLYAECCDRWGIPQEKIQWVPYGLSHVDDLTTKAVFKRRDPDQLHLGFFGTAHPLKGLAFLLKSLAQFPESLRNKIYLHLFCAGWDRSRIPLVLQKNVLTYGYYQLSDLPRYAELYDWLVVPHLWPDNSPVTVLEQLALNKPVICADLGGVVQFFEGKINGLLFQNGSSESLQKVIEQAMQAEVTMQFSNLTFQRYLETHKKFIHQASNLA